MITVSRFETPTLYTEIMSLHFDQTMNEGMTVNVIATGISKVALNE